MTFPSSHLSFIPTNYGLVLFLYKKLFLFVLSILTIFGDKRQTKNLKKKNLL